MVLNRTKYEMWTNHSILYCILNSIKSINLWSWITPSPICNRNVSKLIHFLHPTLFFKLNIYAPSALEMCGRLENCSGYWSQCRYPSGKMSLLIWWPYTRDVRPTLYIKAKLLYGNRVILVNSAYLDWNGNATHESCRIIFSSGNVWILWEFDIIPLCYC